MEGGWRESGGRVEGGRRESEGNVEGGLRYDGRMWVELFWTRMEGG